MGSSIKRPRSLAAIALTAVAVAGCGSSTGLGLASSNSTGSSSGSSASSAAGSGSTKSSSGSSSMAGMNMGGSGSGSSSGSGSATKVAEVNGVPTPVASQVLATADWQGMRIQARTMTPVAFVEYEGSGVEKVVHPPKNTSFHLMIMLNDAHTGVAIPYATVWATILNTSGKVVYDQQQLPMLSAYMGPHYGNNVALPGPGRYTLKLLVSPPVAARHIEYEHVWQTQHQVVEKFTWR